MLTPWQQVMVSFRGGLAWTLIRWTIKMFHPSDRTKQLFAVAVMEMARLEIDRLEKTGPRPLIYK